jgi:xanthine/CO dehydrogenase XdhC/CoxF family maturation factor
LEITADAQTDAMIMTHNYGRDLAWLRAFLPMPLRYVGLLGPKRVEAGGQSETVAI